MRERGHCWWLLGIAGVVTLFVNPYVGLFGIAEAIVIFIMACIQINIYVRAKEVAMQQYNQSPYQNNQLYDALRRLCSAWKVLSVICFFATTFVEGMIWLIASGLRFGKATVVTPIDLFDQENKMQISILLVVVAMICKVLMLIGIWIHSSSYQTGQVRFGGLRNEMNYYEDRSISYMSMNVLCIVIIGGCAVIRSMDYNYSIIAFFDSLIYLVILLVWEIVVRSTKQTYRRTNNGLVRERALRQLGQILPGGIMNRMVIIATWVLAGLLLICQYAANMAGGNITVNGTKQVHIIYLWGSVQNMPQSMVAVMAISAQIICAVMITIRIRKQK